MPEHIGEWNSASVPVGFKADEMKCIAHNIQYSPFTFGWKIGVADNLSIDPHLGVFASYDYTSKMKESGESISWGDFADYLEVDYNHFDAGMNIGVGLWYDRFNLDFTYQRGFIDVFPISMESRLVTL